ncbi:DUF1206 domain-containing protein [Actinomadura fulvescens]|uniref:DUF1206 domain-containing protein n=1 Tax=Actinomadura fulvescens TaxID=46160 RepID=A0ABN3QWY3_9ACTN
MTVKSANRGVQSAGRDAATSSWLQGLGRGGLIARGVNYILIGVLAVQIGLGTTVRQADGTGALHALAAHRGGAAVLWLLGLGFAGLALWRLAEAGYGRAGPDGHKVTKRLASLGRAVFYGFVCFGIVGFVLGTGGPQRSNDQSKDVTARLMAHAGGRWLILAIGLVVAGAGIAMAIGGLRRKFEEYLNLAQMNARTTTLVQALGVVGSTSRGIVFAVLGAFLIVAAATFDSEQAQGLDGALRKIATTPAGPWLLVAVAAGLITFGAYSLCEARWRKVQPGQPNQT